mmetsp:Transcript_23603/g.65470  ORF Transcript_23603/g.65470 Transcript_23603/m.65470 type:complete len:265 (+) Transcript_23603:2056-2850(+)
MGKVPPAEELAIQGVARRLEGEGAHHGLAGGALVCAAELHPGVDVGGPEVGRGRAQRVEEPRKRVRPADVKQLVFVVHLVAPQVDELPVELTRSAVTVVELQGAEVPEGVAGLALPVVEAVRGGILQHALHNCAVVHCDCAQDTVLVRDVREHRLKADAASLTNGLPHLIRQRAPRSHWRVVRAGATVTVPQLRVLAGNALHGLRVRLAPGRALHAALQEGPVALHQGAASNADFRDDAICCWLDALTGGAGRVRSGWKPAVAT